MSEICYRMNREKMIKALEAFDQELHQPLKIAITGASALIINGAITRSSRDIDLLGSSEDLKKDPYPGIIMKIAEKYELNEEWINERAKITLDYLPGYKPDLILLKGNFKHLEPYMISKADSIITKFAIYGNIRSWDLLDIENTKFDDDDLKLFRKKLDELYKTNKEAALRIEIQFKSIKPDFIKTEDGFKFSRASEVAQYALKRYGVILSIDQQNNLDSDVKNLNSTYEKAIIKVDLFALNRILKNKKKEVSNELEL